MQEVHLDFMFLGPKDSLGNGAVLGDAGGGLEYGGGCGGPW